MTYNRIRRLLVCIVFLVATPGASVFAQANPEWIEPFPPFRIAGSLYYVGSKGLANYLITTPAGHIRSAWKRSTRG
jgi:metallo-beta-lactamase class B